MKELDILCTNKNIKQYWRGSVNAYRKCTIHLTPESNHNTSKRICDQDVTGGRWPITNIDMSCYYYSTWCNLWRWMIWNYIFQVCSNSYYCIRVKINIIKLLEWSHYISSGAPYLFTNGSINTLLYLSYCNI